MEILHSIYLGEELDVIADLDEIELLVELEDVHPAPRAPSVEDHRVPPGRRRPGSSREVVLVLRCRLELAVVVGCMAALPAKRRGRGRTRGRGEEQEEKQGSKAGGDASHLPLQCRPSSLAS